VLIVIVVATRSRLDQLKQTSASDVIDTDTVGEKTRTSVKGAQLEVRRSIPTATVTSAGRNFRGYNKIIILPSPADTYFCFNGHDTVGEIQQDKNKS